MNAKTSSVEDWIDGGRLPSAGVLRAMAAKLDIDLTGVLPAKHPKKVEKQEAWERIQAARRKQADGGSVLAPGGDASAGGPRGATDAALEEWLEEPEARAFGFEEGQAEEWIDYGFHPKQAVMWARKGIAPQEARERRPDARQWRYNCLVPGPMWVSKGQRVIGARWVQYEAEPADEPVPAQPTSDSRTATKMAVADLRPNHINSTVFTDSLADESIATLADDIERHGLRHPIEVKPDGTIVEGERRWRAVRRLGWDEVDVVVVEGIDDDEAIKAYTLDAYSSVRDATVEERGRVFGLALEVLK